VRLPDLFQLVGEGFRRHVAADATFYLPGGIDEEDSWETPNLEFLRGRNAFFLCVESYRNELFRGMDHALVRVGIVIQLLTPSSPVGVEVTITSLSLFLAWANASGNVFAHGIAGAAMAAVTVISAAMLAAAP